MRSIFQFFNRKNSTGNADKPDTSLPLPILPKAEQFELLAAHMLHCENSCQLCDLVSRYFGDNHDEVYLLFSISKNEYLVWAQALPVDVFADTEPGLRDSCYLLQQSNSWVVTYQERGHAWREFAFPTREEALAYLYKEMCPFGIYPHLRDEEAPET